jgi:hypothetical protein
MADAASFHRATLEEVALVVERQDPGGWHVAPQAGKWSPAEIAQHLVLAYEPPLAELEGGAGFAVRLPWWKRVVARRRFLPGILAGRFPRGAPAPREIRPKTGAASPAEAARALRENAARFESRLVEAHALRPVRLTHAYFGKLTAPQILQLLAVHAAHHRDQLPPPRRG